MVRQLDWIHPSSFDTRLTWVVAIAPIFALAGCADDRSQTPTEVQSVAMSMGAGVVPHARTFREGRLLVLQRSERGITTRIALDSLWGALVVEASENGVNTVDSNDPGRGIGLSFYDANDPNYNPVQGGDIHLSGSPRLSTTLGRSSITTVIRPIYWIPEPYGGGGDRPVLADVVVEQTLTPVPDDVHLFRLHYRVTYEGTVDRGFREHEFPCVYVGYSYNRLVYYAGNAPWTGGAVTVRSLEPEGTGLPMYVAHEKWAALVNEDDFGITLWTPGGYPYFRGQDFAAARTNYLVRPGYINFGPNTVVEHDAYIYVGDYKAARVAIDKLRLSVPIFDAEVPRGAIEQPVEGSPLRGHITISGWVFDNTEVARIDVLVDGRVVATSGRPTFHRPDLLSDYPYAPKQAGFGIQLNTRALPNGPIVLGFRAYDTTGNVLVFPERSVTVQN